MGYLYRILGPACGGSALVTPVNDIAHDDQKLEEKASALVEQFIACRNGLSAKRKYSMKRISS
jgi:hypothetical protein